METGIFALVPDTLLLLLAILLALGYVSDDYKEHVFPVISPYLLQITDTLLMNSIYITISLTLERYISIAHPFFLLKKRPLIGSLNQCQHLHRP
mgnify:CR=1 FL=1